LVARYPEATIIGQPQRKPIEKTMAQILDQTISKTRKNANKANHNIEKNARPDRAISQNTQQELFVSPKPGQIEHIIGIAWQNKIRPIITK